MKCGHVGVLEQRPDGWFCGQCFSIIWPPQSAKEAGWTAKDCANYCTASFPHPSCKATGARCNLELP